MKVVKKKLSELKSPELNFRLHTEKQIAEFKRSVEMFGQIRPIVIDENNVMLAGNGLHATLLELGWSEASCFVATGLDEKKKKKLMLADNRIFDLGVDDMAAFDKFIIDLKDDLDIPGFDEDMLKSFVMNTSDADILISEYGQISDEQAEQIRENGQRYDERDAAALDGAIQYTPGSVPDEVREAVGYAAPRQAGEAERRYILCPECGVTIWL